MPANLLGLGIQQGASSGTPSFGSGTNIAALATVTSPVTAGEPSCLKVTATAGGTLAFPFYNQYPAVTPGVTYTFGFWLQTTVAGSLGEAVIQWFNGQTFVNESGGAQVAGVAGAWKYFTVTGVCPATVTFGRAFPCFKPQGANEVAYMCDMWMATGGATGRANLGAFVPFLMG